MYKYKVEQLRIMLETERYPEPNVGEYGARLSHWSGRAKVLTIDAEALECLIRYYEEREDQ